MPPEHDDDRARQIEALRRYVAELGIRRERPTTKVERSRLAPERLAPERPAPGHPRRPSLPWLLLTGLLVALALVAGVFVGAVARPDDRRSGAADAASATHSPDTTVVAPVASPACKTSVDRANTMLAIAVRLQGELDEYTRIMGDPSNRELSGREVLEKVAPSLSAGSSDSARFTDALAAYRQVVDQCRLQTP